MSTLRDRIDAMGRKSPVIFGDEKGFAIRFVPGYRSGGLDHAWLHLVIRGQVIGDISEDCIAGTWLNGIGRLLARVENAPERLSHPAFTSLRDDELFAVIWKANGAVDTAYTYLPTLPGRIWSDCHISIDETTDAWLTAMVHLDDRLKFLWKGVRKPCPIDRLCQLYVHGTDPAVVAKVIRSAQDHVRGSIRDLPNVDV